MTNNTIIMQLRRYSLYKTLFLLLQSLKTRRNPKPAAYATCVFPPSLLCMPMNCPTHPISCSYIKNAPTFANSAADVLANART